MTREEGSNWLLQHFTGDKPCSQRFYWLHSYDNALLTVGAMAFDSQGNLYVATSAGLQILDQNGRVRGILTMPVEASQVTSIYIGEGRITLATPSGRGFTRTLNISPPTPGVRPKSQGQG